MKTYHLELSNINLIIVANNYDVKYNYLRFFQNDELVYKVKYKKVTSLDVEISLFKTCKNKLLWTS